MPANIKVLSAAYLNILRPLSQSLKIITLIRLAAATVIVSKLLLSMKNL